MQETFFNFLIKIKSESKKREIHLFMIFFMVNKNYTYIYILSVEYLAGALLISNRKRRSVS